MTERVVLVTGVGGGGVGEQLVKAFRLAKRNYVIVGTDTQPSSLGLQEVDVPVLLPPASSTEYVDMLLAVSARLGVLAICPGSEPELVALAAARKRLASAGVLLFANGDDVLAIGLNKARTAGFLAAHGFRAPRTLLVTKEEQLSAIDFLPAILKPNTGGGGSANVFVVQSDAELRHLGTYLLGLVPNFVAQEYVGAPGDEYTVGVLSDLDGALLHSIAVRRNILSGFSQRSRVRNHTGDPRFGDLLVVSNGLSQGEVGTFPEVASVCEHIAERLASRGPLNIQCRLVDGEVLVFEINPRFSGTASLRALVGFNEPDLLYRRHVEGERIEPRFAYGSGHVVRGLREIVVDPAIGNAAMGAGDFRWHIPSLPFIYRPLETPSNGGGLPDVLPFTLSVDAATGLVRQAPDPEVAAALDKAYVIGSEIPGLMEDRGIGREYADDFLALLAEASGAVCLDGLSVLEIGCGSGYLLSRLRKLGARVLGVEPGAHGQKGAAIQGVPIVRGFFPSEAITGCFDMVVLYLVLEHLPEPTALLAAVREHLAPGGRVAVVVPDAEPFLEEGDASTLFHEHYSYFTAATLATVLSRVGARGIRVRRSRLSRLLFALFSFDRDDMDDVPCSRSVVSSLMLAHHFRKTVAHTVGRIAAYFAEARSLGREVGVYVPGRIVNYVMLGALPLDGVRFFDDSPSLHGRHFPGIPRAVENQDQLVTRPCANVLVMSASFGAKIKARITPLLPATTEVTLLSDLLR